ncbi:energy transducer TonB [Pedobacter sp. KR3-3]|uniref:Energy transducer TonB n=1 Tax=Pedobacter albus TaxID=3113905 RepID=A0ABU7I7J1_9SPHI|nr:energy transducer TonB [Pedobacter sp. KR3-3]MEE1945413.1 energy transducer TonB [Pedobacter sp. KR3-3]
MEFHSSLHHLHMKKLVLLSIPFIFVQVAFTQTKINKVKLDTIHVAGRLIAGDGSKLSNIVIETRSPNLSYANLKYATITDSLGNFKLEGIQPVDTLTFFALNQEHTFINKESRFLNITIWPGTLKYATPQTLVISAKRTSQKKKSEFKTADFPGCSFYITQNPSYPGGPSKFEEYIYKNLKYPSNAIKNNIEGTVTVQFSIAKDGTLLFPSIINGLGYGCDEAVLEVLKKSRKWNPGIRNGRPIHAIYQTDIAFKLTD